MGSHCTFPKTDEVESNSGSRGVSTNQGMQVIMS